jgi:hypothetical protein
MARDSLTSWKTITAPATRPSRLWMGAAESSIGDSNPSRRISTQFARQPHRPVLRDGTQHRVLRGQACRAVDDPEYLGQRPAQRLLTRPAGHRLRHLIQIGHVAHKIGGQHGIADGVERDLGALLLLEQGFFRRAQHEFRALRSVMSSTVCTRPNHFLPVVAWRRC